MKAVLQRVVSASVTVDSQLVSSIGKGVLVFAAVAEKDAQKDVEAMAAKVLKMKMWPDENGTNWKRNVQDIQGEILCGSYVSQFTLLASTKKGNKPDFHGAAGGTKARELYDRFYAKIQELYDSTKVKNGVFQAMMEVNIQNSGPVGVNYSCLDEVVSNCLFVTLEIDTAPHTSVSVGESSASKGKVETDTKESQQSDQASSGEPTTHVIGDK